MKTCIPLQRFETITIELKEYNKETGYSNFRISFDGVCSTSVLLTGDTINIIQSEVKKILAKLKKDL
tara:strand:+ start:403 stop:603 length:201 start_codon:yes stop_codon:yes gene_type:complete